MQTILSLSKGVGMLADTLGVPSHPHLLRSYTTNNGPSWIWFYEALQEALGKDTGWTIRKEPFGAPDNLLPSLSSQHFPRRVYTGREAGAQRSKPKLESVASPSGAQETPPCFKKLACGWDIYPVGQ